MPRSLPVPVREAIWKRSCDHQDAATIAAQLVLNPRTVRRLIERLRREGQTALNPAYDRCGTNTTERRATLSRCARWAAVHVTTARVRRSTSRRAAGEGL